MFVYITITTSFRSNSKYYQSISELLGFCLAMCGYAALIIINLAMPPKGRKVKINMKEFIAKHGLSEEKPGQAASRPEEEWEEETKSQKEPPETK